MNRWNPIEVNAPADVSADETFDLKGEVCPYTFVKSKLMLEMMESGQILQVIVDNDESAVNVPKSLTNEGNAVLGNERLNETDWMITVRKKQVVEYTIREARSADLPRIVKQRHAMFEAMGYVNRAELELTDAKFEQWVEPKLASGVYRGWFVQDENSTIVAGAGLWIMEWVPHALDQSTQRGNILNVYCEPEFADKGLTRRLLIQILDFCRENGIRTVIVNPGDAIRPLYEQMGFRPTGEMKLQVSVPN